MAARKIKAPVGVKPDGLEIVIVLESPTTLDGAGLVAQFSALHKAKADAEHIEPALHAVTTVLANRAHAKGLKALTIEGVVYKVDAVKGSTDMTLVPPRKARTPKEKPAEAASAPVDATTLD